MWAAGRRSDLIHRPSSSGLRRAQCSRVDGGHFSGTRFFLAIHPGRSAVARLGEPLRRYTVIPMEEPVSPTTEPVRPPPNKTPNDPVPVTTPEPQPANEPRCGSLP